MRAFEAPRSYRGRASMVIVTPLHWYYSEEHLLHVTLEMSRLGPPRIRAHLSDGIWYAREGTHRLRAALHLGIAPILVPVPWWKSRSSLERAFFAAALRGHVFDRVIVSDAID